LWRILKKIYNMLLLNIERVSGSVSGPLHSIFNYNILYIFFRICDMYKSIKNPCPPAVPQRFTKLVKTPLRLFTCGFEHFFVTWISDLNVDAWQSLSRPFASYPARCSLSIKFCWSWARREGTSLWISPKESQCGPGSGSSGTQSFLQLLSHSILRFFAGAWYKCFHKTASLGSIQENIGVQKEAAGIHSNGRVLQDGECTHGFAGVRE
jgi:hypothetical protein